MKFGKFLGLLAVALLAAPFAFADGGPVNMEFTGVNGANNGVYYVSPYFGVMNPGTSSAQTVVLFCDDINNEVYIGENWTANVTNLGTAANTTNGFANTRYGGVASSSVYSNPTMAYEEAAWLVSQFASNPTDYVNLQYALWDIMNPGTYWNTDVGNWLSLAASNYSSINPYNFEIITNVGPLKMTGQVQEFITMVPAPEPGTWAMLLCGALALAILTIFRSRLAA
jgi:hypothetical protein